MRLKKWQLVLGLVGVTLAGCGDDDGGDPVADGGVDAATEEDGGAVDGGREDGGALDGSADGGALDGGGVDLGPRDAGPPPMARVLPTNGSALVLSSDDTIAVAANREANTIGVFSVTSGATPTVVRTADLAVVNGEPWAAVIGNDDDTAYVILRRSREVVRVNDLHGTPSLALLRGATGSEPTGLAISPTGRQLYVACWAEGTITILDTATMGTVGTIDLNAALVATGTLGATATARAGLAHPRAIVVTNDGDTDDGDETIYATEYYGQARTDALPTDDSRFDVAKQGLVYRVAVAAPMAVTTIALSPVSNTTFADSLGNTTGCFPNQLQTAAIDSGRLYVSGLCASPRGPTGPVLNPDATLLNPANFKTQVHTTIFAVDLTTDAELPAQRVVLTAAFQARYTAMGVADDGTRRVPLIATDLAFVPGGRVAYLTAYGSDAVFRVVYAADGALSEVGSSANHFINLAPAGMPAGRLPLGIAIARGVTPQAFVLNETTRNISFVSLGSQSVIGAVESTPLPVADSAAAHRLEGRRLFVTGLGRWSFKGQAWNSCESCHGDGLTDGVTWYFARGPRQSISLDGSYDSDDATQRRLYNWSAIFDETHDFELNTRGNSGGVGAVVHATSTPAVAGDRIHFDGTATLPPGQIATATPQAGLNGSVTAMMPGGPGALRSTIADWERVDDYIESIRTPRAPTTLAAADVSAGRALFEANQCAGCHGTNMWTISRVFYTPGETNNHPTTGLLRSTSYTAPTAFPAALNPPSAGAGRTATLRFPAGATAGANDQIQCILRSVGTFPSSGTVPIGPAGIVINEVRQDMTTTAQGASGYNPPPLLGLGTGAPYFHGGNARTIEEAFATSFDQHHTSMSVNFLVTGDRATQIRQLTAFLLSIDEDTAALPVPTAAVLGYEPELCPDAL